MTYVPALHHCIAHCHLNEASSHIFVMILIDLYKQTSSPAWISLIALSSIFLVLIGSTAHVQAVFGAHEWFVRARLSKCWNCDRS